MDQPLAYLITWRCYGTWLHGDERGSVDRRHNGYESPMIPATPGRVRYEESRLTQRPWRLDDRQREVVKQAVVATCESKAWELIAVNVRSNHVHVVAAASGPPEQVMGTLKAWSTRYLRSEGLAQHGDRIWSRHGSTRYLWNEEQVSSAWQYVVHGQDGKSVHG